MNRWLANELAKHRDPTLIGFWPLIDGLEDCSGDGHHGLLRDGVGNPSSRSSLGRMVGKNSFHCSNELYYNPLLANNAQFLECSGTDELDQLAFNTDSKFSVSFWFCENSPNTSGSVVSKGNGTTTTFFSGWRCVRESGFSFIFLEDDFGDTGFGTVFYPLETPNNFSKWHHVTFVYDATVTVDSVLFNKTKWYIDGCDVGVGVEPSGVGSPPPYGVNISNVGPLRIGGAQVASGSANEVQTITLRGATGGTFTASFNGSAPTSALDFDISAADFQTALEGLSTVGSGNMTVSGSDGGPYTVTAAGTLGYTDIPLIGLDITNLTGVPKATVVETTPGSAGLNTSDGPLIAGSGTNTTLDLGEGYGNSPDWSNPDRVTSDDTSYASVMGIHQYFGGWGGPTSYLLCQNFGFSIPTGATITGIQVTTNRYSPFRLSGTTTSCHDNHIFLTDNGVSVGADKYSEISYWSNSSTIDTWGSSTDMWSYGWTPDKINNSSFGFTMQGYLAYLRYAYVDWVKIKVWYNDPATGTNEVQTLSVSNSPTTGSFKLNFGGQQTTELTHDSSASDVQSALRALSSIGSTGVTCTNGDLPGIDVTITFGGTLAAQNVALITVTDVDLGSLVEETTAGSSGADFEIPSANIRLVRIYNRVLNSNEVQAIHQRERFLESFRTELRLGDFVESVGMTCYISGCGFVTQNIPLYINGFTNGYPSASMNLFLQGESAPIATSSITLFVRGSNVDNQVVEGIDLFIYSDADGNKVNANIPLSILGESSDTTDRSMNLWIDGCAHTASASLDLYIENTQLGVTDGITLFIQGEGTTEGASPAQGSMNLFLKRDPAEMITLYIAGPGESYSENITLFIEGAVYVDSSVDLAIPNVVGYSQATTRLYTHGF